MTINIQGKLLSTAEPLVMGILNSAENSFYDGGKYLKSDEYLAKIEKMLAEGADIIDVGCMATNPNATELSEKEELDAVEKTLNPIIKHFPNTIFSIDTWRSSVAELAVGMGVSVIVDDRTFVPVRYVAEMLGAYVEWDAKNYAAYIRYWLSV